MSAKDAFNSFNSICCSVNESSVVFKGNGLTFLPAEIGKTFNSSSTTKQFSHEPSERIKRSLNRAVTSS